MKKTYNDEIEESLTPLTICEEASRCLLCYDAPCSKSCPAGTDPAKFIRSVRFRNFKGACETIRINNVLGSICARVCPQEKYCQLACSRCGIDNPIKIGLIQRYLTDFEEKIGMKILTKGEPNNKKIAIVGSGPSGLALAGELLQKGFEVDIYEKESKLGGYLRYGIPEYRLPNKVVDVEIQRIIDLGLNVHTNTLVGKDITIDELKNTHDAVFLGIGCSKGKTLPMFENNPLAETAVDFLKRAKDCSGNVKIYNDVLVIGGGDVAMDVCTTLKLLGVPNVTDVVYEEFKEFKASKAELALCREQNVTIIDGYVPQSVKNDTVVFKHRHLESELSIKAEHIILAVGQQPMFDNLGVKFELNEVAFRSFQSEDKKIWAIGDISHDDKSVVAAVRTSKQACEELCKYLEVK